MSQEPAAPTSSKPLITDQNMLVGAIVADALVVLGLAWPAESFMPAMAAIAMALVLGVWSAMRQKEVLGVVGVAVSALLLTAVPMHVSPWRDLVLANAMFMLSVLTMLRSPVAMLACGGAW